MKHILRILTALLLAPLAVSRPAVAILAALGILTVFFGRPTEAGDWNPWRGPGRDGQSPGFQVPENWPKELRLQWKVEVGGQYDQAQREQDHRLGRGLVGETQVAGVGLKEKRFQ